MSMSFQFTLLESKVIYSLQNHQRPFEPEQLGSGKLTLKKALQGPVRAPKEMPKCLLQFFCKHLKPQDSHFIMNYMTSNPPSANETIAI